MNYVEREYEVSTVSNNGVSLKKYWKMRISTCGRILYLKVIIETSSRK